MNLTDEQLIAINDNSSRIVLKATASSGKTKVLTERIKRLISEGVNPENIYSISYTVYSADEIKSRLNNEKVFSGTLHSLGLRILLNNSNTRVMTELLEKNYEFLLRECLKPDIQVPEIEHLLVDEFQDITEDEYLFIEKLKAKNTFYVGDINQCIYSFKGAKPEIFERIANSFSTTKLQLTKNFRNTKEILDYSQKFITSPMPSISIRGSMPCYEVLSTSFLLMIQRLRRVEPKDLKNWTILVRTNKDLDEVINILEDNCIKFVSWKKTEEKSGSSLIRELEGLEGVKVMTIHSSKGLEFDNVIAVNLTYYNKEEVRISYVAVTRARNNLYITKMYSPKRNNKTKLTQSKEFLF